MKNEKSTFSVLFYLKKDKMKKNGLVPIHARITINGKQTQFNTKLEVLETNWKSGRAIGKSMEIQRLNSMLDDIKANIRSHFHNQLMRDSYVTPESVKNALLGKEEEANTIISFFTQHNDQYKKKVEAGEATPKTYSRYELTKLRLTEYMKDEYRVSDLPIRQINKVFIENFYLYIIKNHDCSPNTAMKFIQRFRTVVNFAQGTGLITADPFANYKLKFEYIERGYLDKDEISRICNKDFASKRLEQVRDIFIFSCYTGLSYVDICELTSNDIRLAFDDNLWIIKKRHKTKVTSNIRLLDIPKAILNKYEGKLKNGQLLPIREVFIPEYAKNFNKELSASNIKFYGKIHFDRNRSDNKLNMHCHLIVSRKDQANKKKLSPLTNHKNTKKGTVTGGFDRVNLFQQVEQGFDKLFNYHRQQTESFEYNNTMKNETITEQLNLQEFQSSKKEIKLDTNQNHLFSINIENNETVNRVSNQRNNQISDSFISFASSSGIFFLNSTDIEQQPYKLKKKRQNVVKYNFVT